VFTVANSRRDLGIFLSCPQERGPPSINYFV
jgi:hypothetical protein